MSQSSNKATPYFELKGPLPSLPAWVLSGSSHRAPSQLSLLQLSCPTRILAASLYLREVNVLSAWVPPPSSEGCGAPTQAHPGHLPSKESSAFANSVLSLCGTEQGERGQTKNRHAGCKCEELLDGWEMRNKKGAAGVSYFKICLFPWCVSFWG